MTVTQWSGTLVPDPVRKAWRGKTSGPVIRTLAAVIGVPLAISVLFGSVPVGVYLNGVIVGSLYALVAIGIILVYRANRIINFAQASLGSMPAVLGLLLMSRRSFPYPLAVIIVVAGSLVLGGLVEVVFIRRFNNAPRLILTLATIGIAQFLGFFEASMNGWIKDNHRRGSIVFRVQTPLSTHRRHIEGVTFNGEHLLTVVLVLAITIALGAFFRYTQYGMAVRASAENSDRASLLGIPVKRVRTVVWIIAALLSAVGVFQRGVMLDTLPVGLAGTATLLYGLAPAVIARMENMPVAFMGGIALGVVDQATFYATRNATVSGALILPIVLVALLWQRKRLSRAEDTGVSTWREVKEFRPIPRELRGLKEVVAGQWAMRAGMVALIVAAPYLAGTGRKDVASLLVIYAIVGVSLVILTGWGGQISLGQFALTGLGAAVAGGLVANHHVSFMLAIPIAGLVGAALAVAIGIPAVRLPGLFLAVTTLAFAVNTQYFFLQRRYFAWLLPDPAAHVDRPVLWGQIDARSDLAFYYLCVAVLVLTVACARSIRSHRSGRVMIAVRDNARAAQSYGINLTRTRLVAFAMSGFFAAVAGALFAHLQGVVDSNVFTPERSLEVFAMAVIGGLTSVGGALAGAAYIVGFEYFLPKYSLLASGLGMLFLLLFFPGGLSELGFTMRDAFLRRLAIQKRIHVPSLLADSRHAFLDTREEEEELVASSAEAVEAAVDDESAPAAKRRRRWSRAGGRVSGTAVAELETIDVLGADEIGDGYGSDQRDDTGEIPRPGDSAHSTEATR
jgi:branched-chain amino acid transport system permease protein